MTTRFTAKPQLTYKGRMERHSDTAWLIWSNKWGCWYRANSAGYTSDIAQAGIYTKEEAATHYDGPDVPRRFRDTEPFPISAARRHIDLCARDIDRTYIQQMANIARLYAAMEEAA
ncbi:hypothetical protein [Sphingobium yanoikuyae]|uniref:hypothetical protein n=1 Tax=Sphingobium yanoikuyae TaxID=13690 RepID=UPI0031D0F1B0